MDKKQKKENLVLYKLLYTAIILLVYSIGKGLPLYGIDVSVYLHKTIGADDLLLQTISGDVFRCSLFALGISPYMMGSMFVQIISAFRKSEVRSKISPKKTNRFILIVTLVIAVAQALIQVQELVFRVTGWELYLAQGISVLEMVTGAMIIMWLCNRNKKYGIGGQSALVYANVIDAITTMILGQKVTTLVIPLVFSLIVMMIIIVLENSEMRIPVQRISIHNIYADKNYLAIKLNPIGVMPAMFASAAFMIPLLIVQVLSWFFADNEIVMYLSKNLTMTQPLGIGVYIAFIYILSIGFSRVFINPRELTEQFLKSGDSLLNVHSGKDTRKYLSRTINGISFCSATIMSVCLLIPMILQMNGVIEGALASLPSSILMLTGISCNLSREIKAIRDLEAYKPFV